MAQDIPFHEIPLSKDCCNHKGSCTPVSPYWTIASRINSSSFIRVCTRHLAASFSSKRIHTHTHTHPHTHLIFTRKLINFPFNQWISLCDSWYDQAKVQKNKVKANLFHHLKILKLFLKLPLTNFLQGLALKPSAKLINMELQYHHFFYFKSLSKSFGTSFRELNLMLYVRRKVPSANRLMSTTKNYHFLLVLVSGIASLFWVGELLTQRTQLKIRKREKMWNNEEEIRKMCLSWPLGVKSLAMPLVLVMFFSSCYVATFLSQKEFYEILELHLVYMITKVSALSTAKELYFINLTRTSDSRTSGTFIIL